MARDPRLRRPSHRRRSLGQDVRGQMMMLSAIVLLVGFVALAGMVSRVNQLGSQTGIEARHAILDQVDPMADAIDRGIAGLSKRTVTVTTASASLTITGPAGTFSAFDIGLYIAPVSGTSIPDGTKIASVTSSTTAIMTAAATASGSQSVTLRHPGLALTTSTTPTLETGIIGMLEQLQLVQAGHGLWMDYELTCTGVTAANKATGAGGNPAQGVVIAHLSDGTVWIEIRSTIYFARGATSASCVSFYG